METDCLGGEGKGEEGVVFNYVAVSVAVEVTVAVTICNSVFSHCDFYHISSSTNNNNNGIKIKF